MLIHHCEYIQVMVGHHFHIEMTVLCVLCDNPIKVHSYYLIHIS